MPIFIQWKWQEKTKTFLVIFHFVDDFSAANLRAKIKEFGKEFGGLNTAVSESYESIKMPYLTWAPSHPELGLLSGVLNYANIINGLKYDRKEKISHFLEGKSIDLEIYPRNTRILIEFEIKNGKRKPSILLWELNANYIDYLQKLLKQYS